MQNKAVLALSLSVFSHSAFAVDDFREAFEANFAAAVLFSDSNAISLGFQNFDPNRIADIGDDFGNQGSLDLKKNLGVTTLPYTFDLPTITFEDNSVLEQRVKVLFSYLKQKQDVTYQDFPVADTLREEVYTVAAHYSVTRPWSEHWSIGAGIGTNLMYLNNSYTYRGYISEEDQARLNGNLVNTSAWSQTFQPNLNLHYKHPQSWGRWEAFSDLNYFYGYGWGEANGGDIGNPEGLYWVNGIKGFYDITHWGGYGQTLFSSIRHININGDLKDSLNTHEYWEASIGWLVSPPFLKDYVDNIGIGINLNYGSSLSGGTIILLFNQD
ncbi:hypothetical protein JCM19232_456 [Vibrio ishigakensis]|uniref:Solitary outer membrane autotransporter-like beta-barrel domain-containing protein n=1 Tax=Vibrio ishigakensis TaxID=1481914 RepID=A0A0B8PAB3_9VIBR|nr:hypothetical protein JCM19232_456 [Vibrio ishigakensis]